MSLVRGSRGLIYFVHQFKPKFIEAGLLADAEMAAQVKAITSKSTCWLRCSTARRCPKASR